MKNLLIVLILIQPFINKMNAKFGLSFDIYNELLTISVFIGFLYNILRKKRVPNFFFLYVIFFLYMLIVCFFRGLLPLSILQIFIYSQFFFYFFYFYTLEEKKKKDFLINVKKIFDIFLYIIIVITLIEIPFSAQLRDFMGVHDVNRGINGFYLVSFFGSGPSLSNYMCFYVIIWYLYHYSLKNRIRKRDFLKIVLAIIIAVLSFSRKEVLLICLFMLLFPYPTKSRLKTWIKKIIFLCGGIIILMIYYLTFFTDANNVALSSKYIRWKIINKSYEILGDFSPFGVGVGTFGSRVSLMNKEIYEKYNIGTEMLGWGDKTGPIYDSFFFTFTTELGIGIFIYLFFIFKVFEADRILKDNYTRFIKGYIIFIFFTLGLFTPIINNWVGYLYIILLAILIKKVSLFRIKMKYV